MAKVMINESTLTSIANAIRSKIHASDTYKPHEMPLAIESISTGITPIGNINITTMSSTDVTNYATAQVVDSDLVASNIKKNVNILGVVGTYDAGSGGSVIQYSPVMTQIKNKTSYTTTNSSITVAQSGTYKCSWVNYAYAAGSSSTYATQLYKNGSAVGSVHNAPAYSGTSSFVATENSISLNAGDTIEVRARTRSGNSYYTTAGMLVIEKL